MSHVIWFIFSIYNYIMLYSYKIQIRASASKINRRKPIKLKCVSIKTDAEENM